MMFFHKTRLYKNRPPPIQTKSPVKTRATKWENKFNKDYPDFIWTLDNVSSKFLIPKHILKPMTKQDAIKYIYDNLK